MDKMICLACVSPMPLKQYISNHGGTYACYYCGAENQSINANKLFDFILSRIEENTATEDDLSHFEYGMIFECGSDEISTATLDVVLAEWLELNDEPYHNDLYQYAPKNFKCTPKGYDRIYFYDEGKLEFNRYEERWETFTDDIRHSYRFFNKTANEFLETLFAFLTLKDGTLKPECVRTIQNGEALYRARSASTYSEIKAISSDIVNQLGPSPRERSTSQRMTPNGISALYCALERETCLSEIRAITGDNAVSVAFTPANKLMLLDLTKLDLVEPPDLSLLDEGYRETMHLKTFVNSLVKKMSKPRGRNDDLSYLSTQVVFEYLRLKFSHQVDGLIFPSVQTGEAGTNVVIFPEACIIGGEYTNPAPEFDFGEPAPLPNEVQDDPFEGKPKLVCLPGSLLFHKIKAIETKSDEFKDLRHLFMSEVTRKQLGVR